MRHFAIILGLLLTLALLACHRHDQEAFYSTMGDADRDGAIQRGWIPEFLPSSSRNIHEVHDLSPSTSWCAFQFDPNESQGLSRSLKSITSDAASVGRITNPHVAWWPKLLRGTLHVQEIQREGFRLYTITRPVSQVENETLLFVIDWQKGRAYFTDAWRNEAH